MFRGALVGALVHAVNLARNESLAQTSLLPTIPLSTILPPQESIYDLLAACPGLLHIRWECHSGGFKLRCPTRLGLSQNLTRLGFLFHAGVGGPRSRYRCYIPRPSSGSLPWRIFPRRPRETEKFVIPDSITTLALDFVPSPLDAWIRKEWILGNNLFAFASHYQEVVILLHTICQVRQDDQYPSD